MQQAELQRLKAMYVHSRLELNGDYLFVPVISKAGGQTTFEWNAQDGTDYYGYDLGESSGHLHVGIAWTQPLFGGASYRVARQQAEIDEEITRNRIRMEEHGLERSVTEQYLLCLLDKIQIGFADSVAALLDRQIGVVRKLVSNGMSKQSDLHLLQIERQSNAEVRTAYSHSYHTHLMDLNLLCGIDDDHDVVLADMFLNNALPQPAGDRSHFAEQFRLDSLSAATSLRTFNLQYKPRLDLLVNGGLIVACHYRDVAVFAFVEGKFGGDVHYSRYRGVQHSALLFGGHYYQCDVARSDGSLGRADYRRCHCAYFTLHFQTFVASIRPNIATRGNVSIGKRHRSGIAR